MKNKLRKNILMCLLGSTRKADVIIDLIPRWIKQNPDSDIIMFDPMNRIIPSFTEKVKYFIEYDKDFKWVDYLIDKYKKEDITERTSKLLVINGGNILFPLEKKFAIIQGEKFKQRPKMHRKFKCLLAMRRMLNMDMIITFLDPESMPIIVDRFVTDYIVLPILHEYEPDRKSPNHAHLETYIKAITEYNKQYGNGIGNQWIRYSVESREVNVVDSIDEKKFLKIIDKFEDEKYAIE